MEVEVKSSTKIVLCQRAWKSFITKIIIKLLLLYHYLYVTELIYVHYKVYENAKF